LAHNLAGGEKEFVKRMNAKAKEIGLKHTRFVNASGLYDSKQVTTARDMAKMAHHLVNKYPVFYEYFSRQKFEFDGVTYDTYNRLMKQYKGMDGIKTGYIRASGFNIMSSVERDGRRLIGISFGGHSALGRDHHMAELLDNAFKAPMRPNNPHNAQNSVQSARSNEKDVILNAGSPQPS